jgi:hypothetical protein
MGDHERSKFQILSFTNTETTVFTHTYMRRTSVSFRTRAVESSHSVMTSPSIQAW